MNCRKTENVAVLKRRAVNSSAVYSKIVYLRQARVILDADLAKIYGVSVKRLNEQVKRNQDRFPSDFMFRLNEKDRANLRSQIATSSEKHGGRRYLPYAFTEHGAIMAATVLNSERAVQMSVFVVRAFVRLRELLAANRQLAAKIYELETRLDTHDSAICDLIRAIRQLTNVKRSSRRQIGVVLPGDVTRHEKALLQARRHG
jgi:phage regulator Rha-like protein